jgi:hypothetical protein
MIDILPVAQLNRRRRSPKSSSDRGVPMRAFGIVSLVVLVVGCGSVTPTPTTPTPVAACVTNNSAQVTFENRLAAPATALTVKWDTAMLTTQVGNLQPNTISAQFTATAGVPHTVVFLRDGVAQPVPVCSPAPITLVQCSTLNIVCQ